MTIETTEEFQEQCALAISALAQLAEYTDNGERELDSDEALWLMTVILSFQTVVGGGDGDNDSDYRIGDDETLT
jgi:hypothetical protein